MRIGLLFVLLILGSGLAAITTLQQSAAFSQSMDGFDANPALLSADPDFGLSFRYDYEDDREEMLAVRLPRWLGMVYDSQSERTNVAGGFELRRNLHLGLAWSDTPTREARLDAGAVWRPVRQLSGAVVARDITQQFPDLDLGRAFRPLRDYITLYVQQPLQWNDRDDQYDRDTWFAGVSGKPLPGVVLDFTYNEDEIYQASLRLDFGQLAAAVAWYGKDADDAISRQTLEWSFHHERGVIPRRHAERLELAGDMSAGPRSAFLAGPSIDEFHLLTRLRAAGNDPEVSRIELVIRDAQTSPAFLEELRREIARCPRPVYAWLDSGCLEALYLGAACNKVYLTPGRPLQPGLYSPTQYFWRGAMQKLGVRVDAAKFGALAPADETLTADTFSEPVRASVIAVAEQLRDNLWSAVERDRKLNADTAALMRGQAFMPEFAVEHGLADEVAAPPLPRACSPWASLLPTPQREWFREGEVAVLCLEGALLPGQTRHPLLPEPPFGSRQCGAQTLLAQIARVRRDPDVKAVVLRIDSGGGETGAVAQVYEALRELNRAKPVVVSAGGTCASGALYIATAGRRLYVDENTVTAGLGVLGLATDADGLYRKLGVTGGNLLATPDTPDDRFAPLGALQNQLLSRIAAGRNLPILKVKEYADGRTMLGAQAIEAGLADKVGGLLDALDYARGLAGLSAQAPARAVPAPAPLWGLLRDPQQMLPRLYTGYYYY